MKYKFIKQIQLKDYRDKTMVDKLIYTPNDNTQNYHFYRLKLVVEMFEYSTE